MFGEEPGFSTLKEVFGNSVSYINSVETGLSADPLMVRGISELNKVSVISNSDSHSTNFHRSKSINNDIYQQVQINYNLIFSFFLRS